VVKFLVGFVVVGVVVVGVVGGNVVRLLEHPPLLGGFTPFANL